MAIARLDVVVPLKNKRSLLPETLGSIAESVRCHGAASLTIVDNGSTDGSLEFTKATFGVTATVVEAPTHLTIGAVRNLGASHGSAPILTFLDSDCVVDPQHLVRIETVFLEHPEAVVVGCKIALPPAPSWVEKTWNDLHDDGGDGRRSYINSANLSVRRAAFTRVEGFSERLETGEDSELCQRLGRGGGLILQDQRLAVAHLDNAKTLAAFFLKERWRGLGMFGTVSSASIDKPTAMTSLHLLILVIASWLMVSGVVRGLTGWLTAAMCLVAVPVLTVGYRLRSARGAPRLVPSLVLYQLYYLARINAMLIIAWRWLVSRRRTTRSQSGTRVNAL